uniref:Uncharacterized protein n=1 Tax=Ciona intestinalis TaxID=7719 RepID=H2XZN5_CIOIN
MLVINFPFTLKPLPCYVGSWNFFPAWLFHNITYHIPKVGRDAYYVNPNEIVMYHMWFGIFRQKNKH